MNNYTKLFIQNQEIDLLADSEGGVVLPLNITKQANNLKGEVAGDFTKASVTVLATKNNIAALGEGRGLFEFRIENDGAPSYFGTASIRKIPLTSQGYESIQDAYVLNLLGNNASWFKRLGGVKLSELTNEVITWDAVNVHAGFLAGTFNSRIWGFGLIKFKQWANSTGAGADLRYQPSIYESTPLIQIKYLLESAFNSIGYTINSIFLNLDFAERLILAMPIPQKMPFGYNEKYLNTTAALSAPTAYPITILQTFIFDSLTKVAPQHPAAYNILTGEYTAPLQGFFKLKMSFTFAAAPVPNPALFYLFSASFRINGIDVAPEAIIAFTNFTLTDPYPAGETVFVSTVVQMNLGDVLTVLFSIDGQGMTIDAASLEITGEAVPQPGMPLDFKYLLRDWKITSTILGLKSMFNLMFESDDARRIVTIEPKDGYVITDRVANTTTKYEGFYKDSNQKDYSQIINQNKKSETKILDIDGRYIFKYQTDNDPTINFIEGVNELGVYEAQFGMVEGSDKNRTKTIQVPFFAKTIHVSDHLVRFEDTLVYPQFMLKYPENYVLDPTITENENEYLPIIGYHAGQRVGFEDKDGTMEEAEFPGLEVLVPMTFMVNYNDQSGLDPNLGFNNVTIEGNEVTGLAQKFYLQDLARQNQGVLTSHYAPFNSIDEHNFSHRTKAFIHSKRYVVQLVTAYNPITGNDPEFKFLLDIYPNSEDIDNIENSNIQSFVTLLTD
jgi:hypothetical protein